MRIRLLNFLSCCFVITFGAIPTTYAGIERCDTALIAVSGVNPWRHEVNAKSRKLNIDGDWPEVGHTEYREVSELPGAFIFLSFLQWDMNMIFTRASIYAEGGYKAASKTVVPHDHPDVEKLNRTTSGQDLKSDDIIEFFKKAIQLGKTDPKYKLNSAEAEFYYKVLPILRKKRKRFVVLAFSYQSMFTYQENVGHEIMHAQYFLLPKYRKVVKKFWKNRVRPNDKTEIRAILSQQAGHDPADEALMENEFQAYTLEVGAENDLLQRYLKSYRTGLRNALKTEGFTPIQIR